MTITIIPDTEIVFRGCAEAMYKHDYGCDREMQVDFTMIDNTDDVDDGAMVVMMMMVWATWMILMIMSMLTKTLMLINKFKLKYEYKCRCILPPSEILSLKNPFQPVTVIDQRGNPKQVSLNRSH